MNKWSNFAASLETGNWEEMTSPTFRLDKKSSVFTIGSCFARNIEDILSQSFEFPIANYEHQKGEYSGARPRGILNKFTPLCMLSELEWLFEINLLGIDFEDATATRFLYLNEEQGEGIDLGLQQYIPVSLERFWERRRHIYSIYNEILSVDCVVLTLGLIEQWYYKLLVVQHAPNNRQTLKGKDFFGFEVLQYEAVEDALKRILKIIKTLNKNVKILFTISPVPLEKTFSGDHICVANAKSKATLLSAASSVLEKGEVDYFPSYEIVSMLGSEAFEKDKRHVKNSAVEKVCNEFIRAYT